MEQPSYYSILTANVRYDKTLKANEKLLFSEITALSNKNGYCHAGNKYFADLYGVSKISVSNWINHLKACGYLKVEMIKEGKEIKERHLYPISTPIKENFNTPSRKLYGGVKENFKENTTSINTTRTNKDDDDTHNSTQPDENPFDVANKANINVNSGYHMPVFVDFVDKLGASVVCWAIHKTDENARHPNWNYLQTVLKGLEAHSVRTVEQAEKLSEEHKQKTQRNYRGRNAPQVRETMPDWSKQDEATRTKKASASALAKARARQVKNREAKEGAAS